MSSRNVAVRSDVYQALLKEKRAGESFTGLFVRLLHQQGTVEEVRGGWGQQGLAQDLRSLTRLRRAGGGNR